MKRRWVRGACLAALLAASAGSAHAEADDLVRRAMALEEAGKAADAYALLAPAQAARLGDPDFDFALGLAAADTGRPGEAIVAFQRVLAAHPDNARVRAELARVYAEAGDVDTARQTYDTVVNDPSVPDPVRQRLGRLVRQYDRQISGGGAISGFVESEAGYDGDVNAATNLTSITLPVFAFLGPASLNGAARSMDDGFGQVQGGLSAVADLSRQTRAYISALGSWRDNFHSNAFDQGAATLTGGLSHTLAGGPTLSISGQGQRIWLGRHAYRTAYGSIGQATWPVTEGGALSVQAQYFRFDYDGDPSRDAQRYGAGLTYAARLWFVGAAGGEERTLRATARHLGYAYGSAQTGTEYPLGPRVALLGSASVEYRRYQGADPLFLKVRSDTQIDLSAGVRWVLAEGLSLRPRVTYTRNLSNLALYDYARTTASVAVRYEF